MSSLRKIGLDTRALEHPVPLEMAIRVLHELDEETYLYMLHRKNPIPLIDLAKENHFQVLTKEDTSSKDWHVLISKNKTIDLNNFLNV
jgi:hypothetical protein